MRKIDLTDFQVATSETAREINRRIVLNLIRKNQPISRADLARQTGLQRSTVSAITEQLIANRWVMEGALGHLPRGRKPTFLHLNVERAGIIGITIRPGSTVIVLARLDTSFIAETSIATDGTSTQFVERVVKHVTNLIKTHRNICIEGIGVSLPGRVDSHSQKLIFAPNLKWSDLDLKTPLERATGLPVELENAANACALAELWCGRHSDSTRNLITVTVSEGIGVGIILNGQLVRGATGTAGEFGHVSLNEKGPLCNCGNHGCWEMYASNSAAVDYYEQSISSSNKPKHGAAKVLFSDLLVRARRGDVKACQALNRMAEYLGTGLAMLTSGLSPDAIVIIGEVTAAWDRIEPIINDIVRKRCLALAVPRILPTDSTVQPRLRGAVVLVLQKHFSAPQIF